MAPTWAGPGLSESNSCKILQLSYKIAFRDSKKLKRMRKKNDLNLKNDTIAHIKAKRNNSSFLQPRAHTV